MGDFSQIIVERDGPVALVTLNRPDRMNAWTWTMSRELGEVFEDCERDDDVRAVVVTGAGHAFCAGADLESGGETFSGGGTSTDAEASQQRRPAHTLGTPIIAAINGAAVGAGLTMPIEWDIRITATDAKLGFVFNRRGIMPDADLLWFLPRLIGLSRALDLLLTARIFSGAEAAEWGLVSRAVPKDDVLDTALAAARDIAENTAPVSVAITKRLAYEYLNETDRASARRHQSQLFWWTGKQPDAKEGVMSFVEKRTPDWTMSKTRDFPEDIFAPGDP